MAVVRKVKILKKGKEEEKTTGKSETKSNASNFELTKRYSDQQDKMIDVVSNPEKKKAIEKPQGISINKSNLEAKPIMFKRKIVRTEGPGGTTKIIGTDGKTVKYEGANNMKATEDALAKNKKEEDDTNKRRGYNSNFYNVNSGAKKDLDDKDKEALIEVNKAVVKK